MPFISLTSSAVPAAWNIPLELFPLHSPLHFTPAVVPQLETCVFLLLTQQSQ